MSTDSRFPPTDIELRIREIALREAVKRANVIDGAASTTELAAKFERYLWSGKAAR